MANLVTYAKTAWQDLKTAITAARLNNMEQGISDCATQINKLGDSVCQKDTVWYWDKASVDMADKSVVVCLCSIGDGTPVQMFFIWRSSSNVISTSRLPDGMTCTVSNMTISFAYTNQQTWVFLTV